MAHAGVSTQTLSEKMGISYQAVRQVVRGRNKALSAPNSSKAAEILGVSGTWLATGRGDMVPLTGSADAMIHTPSLRAILAWEHIDDLPEGEFVLVPLLDVRLSAGPGAQQTPEIWGDEAKPIAFRSDWIRKMGLRPRSLVAMVATGHSMEPRIYAGDALVIDRSQADSIVDGAVYALYYDGGERVKRLNRLPGGGLRIISDNKDRNPPIDVPASETDAVRIIGRVVHVSGQGGL